MAFLTVLLSGLAMMQAASPAEARATTRACGGVLARLQPEGEGSAHHILATRVSCRTARLVAKRCVSGRAPRGWIPSQGATRRGWGTKHYLQRGRATVTFYLAGGGGCD